MVFVDTSAWFAKFVPDDPDHGRINAWLRANTEPVLTTDYCIDEVLTLLVAQAVAPCSRGRQGFLSRRPRATSFCDPTADSSRLDSFSTASGRRLELHRLHEQNRY